MTGDKENAQDAENFLKQCKKGCPRARIYGAGENIAADQKLYEKDDRDPSKEREDKLCDRKAKIRRQEN